MGRSPCHGSAARAGTKFRLRPRIVGVMLGCKLTRSKSSCTVAAQGSSTTRVHIVWQTSWGRAWWLCGRRSRHRQPHRRSRTHRIARPARPPKPRPLYRLRHARLCSTLQRPPARPPAFPPSLPGIRRSTMRGDGRRARGHFAALGHLGAACLSFPGRAGRPFVSVHGRVRGRVSRQRTKPARLPACLLAFIHPARLPACRLRCRPRLPQRSLSQPIHTYEYVYACVYIYIYTIYTYNNIQIYIYIYI